MTSHVTGGIVRVRAASRLHFGMFSLGQNEVRSFGGVGVMVDRPGLELRLEPAEQFVSSGPFAARVRQVAEQTSTTLGWHELPKVKIEVVSAPRQHYGLGSGTQLGLSVAAALLASRGLPHNNPATLAQLSGRGLRSAVGAYGFVHGGLIIEAGKHAGRELAPLVAHFTLPTAWRFVVILPERGPQMSGRQERDVFAALPSTPKEVTAALCQEALLGLAPAAVEGRFAEFAESLFRFGYQSGRLFAAHQAGAFATAWHAQVVDSLRASGIRGVGQSSWGPALFALVETPEAAEQLVTRLKVDLGPETELLSATPTTQGASIQVD